MKTKIPAAVALSVLFLMLAVVGFRSTFAAKPVLAKNPQVILRVTCQGSDSSVDFLDGSVGAPALLLSTPCAQDIANLLNTGFAVASTERSSYIYDYDMTYTMIAAKGVKASNAEHDVLRLGCGAMGSLSFYDGSAGAPVVTAITCSQALADALNGGFALSSTEGAGFIYGQQTVYTLVRSSNGD